MTSDIRAVVAVRTAPEYDAKTIGTLLDIRRRAGFARDPILLMCDHGALPPDFMAEALLAPLTVVVPPILGRVVSDKMHCFWYAVEVMTAQPADMYMITSAEIEFKRRRREEIWSMVRKSPDKLVMMSDGVAMSRRVIQNLQPKAFDAMRGIPPHAGAIKQTGMPRA